MGTLQDALKRAGLAQPHPGVDALRGEKFEQHALVFFLLGRLMEHPDLKLQVQGPTDALLVFERNGRTIGELVECKKGEALDDRSSVDAWVPRAVTTETLKKWNVAALLEKLEYEADLYCTLLAFGEIKDPVSKFTPQKLRNKPLPVTVGHNLFEGFPADYVHSGTLPALDVQGAKTHDEPWRRLRVVPLEDPDRLELIGTRVLEQSPFDVSGTSSSAVYAHLHSLIVKRQTLRIPDERWVTSAQIWEPIKAGRRPEGRWRHPPEPADTNVEPERAARVWAALEQKRFAVISGAPGQGKTRLCCEVARLAKEAWRGDAGANVYYLAVGHETSVDEERRFLENNLEKRILFIVDDEHRGADVMDKIVKAYADRWYMRPPQARLLVTSAKFYRPSQNGDLNRAEIETLVRSREDVVEMLTELKRVGGLHKDSSPDTLADLAKNNLKLALLVDRAAAGSNVVLPLQQWRKRQQLVRGLEDWLHLHLGRQLTPEETTRRIRPIFVIGAYDIRIPRSWSSDVATLEQFGFLERSEQYEPSEMVVVREPALAALLAEQVSEKERLDILCEYVERYPMHVAELLSRLSEGAGSVTGGQKLVKEVVARNRDAIFAILADRHQPIPVSDMARILSACDLYSSRRLLRQLVEDRQPRNDFFDRLIQVHACPPGDLSALLNVARRIDPDLTARAAAGLSERRRKTLLEIFRSPTYELSAVGSCLRALRRCDPDFALALFKSWQEHDVDDRINALEEGPQRLTKILRYCSEIRWIDRRAALATLERYVSVDAVAESLAKWGTLKSVMEFFALFQRLHRRLAHRCFLRFADEQRHAIAKALRGETSLLTVRNELYELSRFDRRMARRLVWNTWPHIQRLIREQHNYHDVGFVIQGIGEALGYTEARSWIAEIDRDAVLNAMRAEQRSVNLVGEMLMHVNKVDPKQAEWFASRLDWTTYLPRIRRWILPNLGYLLRGFLVTTPAVERSTLVNAIVASKSVLGLIERGWAQASSLQESAVMPAMLLDAGMPRDAIQEILDVAGGFQRAMLQRLGESGSCGEIARVLYVLARYESALAWQGLREYCERVRKGRQAGSRNAAPFLPETSRNLTEVGEILTIAAALEPALAAELAEGLDATRLAERAAWEDDLGRLRSLLSGLSDASHGLTLRFLDAFDWPEAWERKVSVTQNFRSTAQFTRTMMLASKSRGSRFCRHVMERLSSDVVAELEATASLSTIAGWMKSCTLAKVTGESLAKLGDVLDQAAPFEGRLSSYLEAAEAAWNAGLHLVAERMAARAIEHGWQVNTIAQLDEWIDLYDRVHRLEAAGVSDLGKLFARDRSWHFDALLAAERNGVVAGLAWRVMSHVGGMSAKDMNGVRGRILSICERETDVLQQVLGFVLAEGSDEQIGRAVDRLSDPNVWRLGLILVAGDASALEVRSIPSLMRIIEAAVKRAGDIDPRALTPMANLQLGLELRARSALGAADGRLSALFKEAQQRAADEARVGLQHLLASQHTLDASQGTPDFWRTTPSALAQIFRSTLLRASRLDWLADMDRDLTKAKFGYA